MYEINLKQLLKEDRLVPVYKFDFKFYAYFQRQIDETMKLLTFSIPDTKQSGILAIENAHFQFHFIE